MTFAFDFAQRGQRVGGFAALRDGEQQRVAIDRRIAVAEFAGVFDFDRDAGEFFDQVFADHGGVPTGAAGSENQAVHLTQLLRRKIEAAEYGRGLVAIEPAAHGVLRAFRAARKSL